MMNQPHPGALTEPRLCEACGRPVVSPSPLICDCGASLDWSTQAAIAARTVALRQRAYSPSPLWVALWVLSVPAQVFTIIAILDPTAREFLFNIHDSYGLIFLASGLAGLSQPCFLLGWWLTSPSLKAQSPPRRLAWGLAAFSTILLASATFFGVIAPH